LAHYVNALPSDDLLCSRLSVCLEPFIVDDERIECAMYPVGEAITYLENEVQGGDFRSYVEGLVCAIEQDHNRWVAHVAIAGDAASWTLESGPPTVIGLVAAPMRESSRRASDS
jgi:hypothetical protein